MVKKFNVLLFAFCFIALPVVTGSDLFPPVNGWEMQEDERVYTPADLWELINGAAEAFLDYTFMDLHLAEYTKNEQIIRVEIYHHGSLENAYGMYSSERMPDYEQVKIGAQGYTSEDILNFFTGPYYIKIMAVGLADVDGEDILRIAAEMDAYLDQTKQMPETISLLPEEGMEYLSDHYVATNFLGYGFLHSAYTARYSNNESFELFIIHASQDEIKNMLEDYRALLKEDKFQKKDLYFVISDMFNGTIFLTEKDEYLVGTVNTDNEQMASDYINRVISKLP